MQIPVRQTGESTIELPPECNNTVPDIPGAVQLTQIDTDDGSVMFSVEATTMALGDHTVEIECGDDTVVLRMFIFRQIGGSRGESSSVTRVAALSGVLMLVLTGLPSAVARKEETDALTELD